ncbi:hypothetical protein AKO1_001300, partial [Acrasis kona]
MSKLAYEAMKGQIIHMSPDFVKMHTKAILNKSNTAEVSYENVLEYLSSTHLIRSLDNGSKDVKEHAYFFVHQSFQEYFAAYHIARLCFKNKAVPTDVVTYLKENRDKRYFLLTWRFTSGILYGKQKECE